MGLCWILPTLAIDACAIWALAMISAKEPFFGGALLVASPVAGFVIGLAGAETDRETTPVLDGVGTVRLTESFGVLLWRGREPGVDFVPEEDVEVTGVDRLSGRAAVLASKFDLADTFAAEAVRGVFAAGSLRASSALRLRVGDCFGVEVDLSPLIWARRSPIWGGKRVSV